VNRTPLLLPIFAALLLAGCASAPLPSPPVSQARLAEAEARAASMVRAGEHAAAARHYDEALRIAVSIENPDAIAENAINLSIVSQWLGRDADARNALASVLDNRRAAFPQRRLLQAELRRAIVELAAHNASGAAAWAQRAGQRCAGSCEYAAAILNVQAQIAFDSRQHAEAARLSQAATERARARNDRVELANALRALGRARLAQGEAALAIPALKEALDIDRELADPRKILADLTELSRATLAAGDRQAADEYRERALAVGRAVHDARGVAEMEAQLRRP
jgi:tetratricopeptide (TPR) repeat protein